MQKDVGGTNGMRKRKIAHKGKEAGGWRAAQAAAPAATEK